MQNLLILNRRIKKFIKLNINIKIDLFKAFLYTAFYRICILFIPFNKLKKRMGKYKEESVNIVPDEVYEVARYISWVVNTVSKYTPWESKCLVQALTVQKMLKWRNISSTIYLGVNKDKDNKIQAHAWSRVGEMIVTGGEVKDYFTQVAKFSNY